MAWSNGGWNRHELPMLRDYEAAKQKYESTKPIRGRSDDTRPLGKRRTTWMQITKGMEDGVEYYAAKLYNTECVKWYANGNMEISVGGWATYTTRDFIAFVLPSSFKVALVRSEIRISGYRVPKEKGLLLTTTPEHADSADIINNATLSATHYRVQDPEQEYTYSINRAKKKEVFNRFKDFRDWLKGYLSLKEGFIHHSESLTYEQLKEAPFQHLMHRYPWSPELVSGVKQCRLQLIEWMQNKEGEIDYDKYIKAAAAIAAAIGRWDINGKSVEIKNFDKLLFKLHAPEILNVEAVPQGTTPKKNAYTAWVNGWIKEVYQTAQTNQA